MIGCDVLEFAAMEAELETLRAQVAQLTAERDGFKAAAEWNNNLFVSAGNDLTAAQAQVATLRKAIKLVLAAESESSYFSEHTEAVCREALAATEGEK